jgi:hypothetical protein
MDVYERAYTFYLRIEHRAWVIGLTAQMQAEAAAEYKRLFPRRRKGNLNDLPTEYKQALKERYLHELEVRNPIARARGFRGAGSQPVNEPRRKS